MRQRRKKGIVEGMLSVADGRTSSVGVDVSSLSLTVSLSLKNSAGTLGDSQDWSGYRLPWTRV
jgi:hypothetical protein